MQLGAALDEVLERYEAAPNIFLDAFGGCWVPSVRGKRWIIQQLLDCDVLLVGRYSLVFIARAEPAVNYQADTGEN